MMVELQPLLGAEVVAGSLTRQLCRVMGGDEYELMMVQVRNPDISGWNR